MRRVMSFLLGKLRPLRNKESQQDADSDTGNHSVSGASHKTADTTPLRIDGIRNIFDMEHPERNEGSKPYS